mgnify:CR=1 FL=1
MTYETGPDGVLTLWEHEWNEKIEGPRQYGRRVAQAQHQATLRGVGKWLEKRLHCGGHGKVGGEYHKAYLGLFEQEIETFLQGKMPTEPIERR